ncbi:MAG: hypothetical protein AAF171_04210 [Cyanobacteria bacterium P01_A01_bin.116]
MTLQDLQNQALRLPVGDRWRLVQSLLRSIQQETPVSTLPLSNTSALADLDPWTQSLVGVIQLGFEDSTDSYVDYLEEKYA